MSFYKKVPGLQRTLESELLFDKVPTAGSTNPVTSDGVKGANSALLDDHDPVGTEIILPDLASYNKYEKGKFYEINGLIYECTERTREGETGSYTYSTTLTKINGVVPALNTLVDRIAALENH